MEIMIIRNSILFKLKILHTPVVEQWIELLKEVLAEKISFTSI